MGNLILAHKLVESNIYESRRENEKTSMTLQDSINLACEYLPDNWHIHIYIECGYAGVFATRPDGSEVDMWSDEDGLEKQVYAVIRLARDGEAYDRLMKEKLK